MLLAMPFLTTAGGECEMDETFFVIFAAGAAFRRCNLRVALLRGSKYALGRPA